MPNLGVLAMAESNIFEAGFCVWAALVASEVIMLFARKEDIDMLNEKRFSCLWSASIFFMLMAPIADIRGYVKIISISETKFYEIFAMMAVLLAALVFQYHSERLAAFAFFLISSALMLLMIWYFSISPITISLLYLLVLPVYHLRYLYRKSK
jgi:hypothetical protein